MLTLVKGDSMRTTKSFGLIAIAIFLSTGIASPIPMQSTVPPAADTATVTSNVTVAPQYDTTHVYVAPEEFDRSFPSLIAPFGGTTPNQGVLPGTPLRAAPCPSWC